MQNLRAKQRVAYVEMDTHAEIAAYFHRLSGNFQQVEVDFYFSRKIAERLPKIDSKAVNSFPELIQNLSLNRYDLIILGTVHRYFRNYLKVVRSFKTAVIVHNKNFSRASAFSLIKGIFEKETAYRLKLLLKEGLLSGGKVYREAAIRFVLDSALADPRHRLLPLIFNGEASSFAKKRDHLVIPGAVENSRRNYPHIFNCLAQWESPLTVTFLGKASSEMVLQLKNLQEKKSNLHLIWFEEKVAGKEFDQILAEASVLWCPIRRTTHFLGIGEIYGETKVSGNIFDVAKAGTWGVFPSAYPVSHPFIISEEDNPLAQIQKLSETLPDFSGYSLQETAARLEAVLQQSI